MALLTEVVKYAGVDLRARGLYMSMIDGFLGGPPIRGANVLIPYSQGQRWVPKFYDERHIVLAGEMHSLASRADLQAQMDLLKSLFAIGLGEQKLEVQRADGTTRYVMAEVLNTLGLQWLIFPTRSTPYSIELVASDPMWYGTLEASQARQPWFLDSGVFLDDGAHWFDQTSQYFAQILTAQNTLVEATNSGTATNRKPVFYLSGAMNAPRIINQRNGYSVQIVATVAGNQQLVIDCGAQQATIAGQPVASSLITLGAGQTDWMHLEAGENTLLVVTGVTPTSVAYQAQYSAAYL